MNGVVIPLTDLLSRLDEIKKDIKLLELQISRDNYGVHRAKNKVKLKAMQKVKQDLVNAISQASTGWLF